MPSTAIVCGILLILIGAAGYCYGLLTGHASLTALIPFAFGLVISILGHAARKREALRKHLMHAALLVALVGFLATAGRLASKFSELSLNAAVLAQASMALVCLIFIALGVRSFIAARRDRS